MSDVGVSARVGAQRAMEALRNGVPNSDAVRALGCMQPEALDRFVQQLDELAKSVDDSNPPVVQGSLIAGGFGSGKSHTLAYFEQEALARNFVVSRVVISKETPLHDPAKLFLAAAREARLPDARGALLPELALRLDYRNERTHPFLDWAVHKQPLGIIAATVTIHERSHDAEVLDQIVEFWAGERLGVQTVRNALKDLGIPKAFEVKTVKVADLAPVRFEFAARLAKAVGLAGWVILLDETELVGRYSLLQRAKAYAELSRWVGAVPGQGIPGVTAVGAITDDYALSVLNERGDREKIPEKLRSKGDQRSLAISSLAEQGMDIIERGVIELHPPNDDTLAASFERLRRLYEQAYAFVTAHDFTPETGAHRPMRSYVRTWVSSWDLERLYPTSTHNTEEEELTVDYSEDPDLARENEDLDAEPVIEAPPDDSPAITTGRFV